SAVAGKATDIAGALPPRPLGVELTAPAVAGSAAGGDAPATLSGEVTDAALCAANPEVERVERPVAPATLRVELKAPVVADKAASVDAPVTVSVVANDEELSVAKPEVARAEMPVVPVTVSAWQTWTARTTSMPRYV